MKNARLFPLALIAAVIGTAGWAAQPDEHAGHHPPGSAGAAATKPSAAKPAAGMARMDTQIAAMKAMHEKMMVAATPEERGKLMAEHMKTMQEGMSMMNDSSHQHMGDMKAGNGSMAARQAMMEKHMAMMGAAMAMMGDRLPPPAK